MAYHKYQSRRSVKRLARKSRRNFLLTLVLVGVLIYSTLVWVLPFFINSIGSIKNVVKPSQKINAKSPQNAAIAPPVFSIPYEATNSAQINIRGYGTSGSRIKLYIDYTLKQTIEVSEDGRFNFENIDLSLGTNNIYGTTLDDNDKESLPSKTIKLIYDNEKPSLIISEREDGKNIQGGDKKVKVSGKTDPGTHIFVNGNQAIVSNEGAFAIDQPLNDGDNIIAIKAIDSASNTTEIERKVLFQP